MDLMLGWNDFLKLINTYFLPVGIQANLKATDFGKEFSINNMYMPYQERKGF
jgi:hypothetical protein